MMNLFRIYLGYESLPPRKHTSAYIEYEIVNATLQRWMCHILGLYYYHFLLEPRAAAGVPKRTLTLDYDSQFSLGWLVGLRKKLKILKAVSNCF